MKTRLERRKLWYIASCGVVLLAAMPGAARTPGAQPQVSPQPGIARFESTDSFSDGTPDFLRLDSPADQEAFRRWFTLIAEYQALRPPVDVPREINDCAALIRFAYRGALHRHDAGWLMENRLQPPRAIPPIDKYRYPFTPLKAALFRTKPGAFVRDDAANGAFAEFADAKTIKNFNTYNLSRDVRDARPGDLLFYRQLEQNSPYHSMIFIGHSPWASYIGAKNPGTKDLESDQSEDVVVYHTGPLGKSSGEIRRIRLSDLLSHPSPRWRPVRGNRNFLGVYRWNILRDTN